MKGEQSLHRTVADHLERFLLPEVIWFHSRLNARSARDGAYWKAMGVKKDVWDFCIMWSDYTFDRPTKVLWCELKYGKNGLTAGQKAFQRRAEAQGHACFVAYTSEGLDAELLRLRVPMRPHKIMASGVARIER